MSIGTLVQSLLLTYGFINYLEGDPLQLIIGLSYSVVLYGIFIVYTFLNRKKILQEINRQWLSNMFFDYNVQDEQEEGQNMNPGSFRKVPQMFLRISRTYYTPFQEENNIYLSTFSYSTNEKPVKNRTMTLENLCLESEDQAVNICLLCFDQISDCILMDCGHSGICFQCANQIKERTQQCHICRQSIREIVLVQKKSMGTAKIVGNKEKMEMLSKFYQKKRCLQEESKISSENSFFNPEEVEEFNI